MSNTFKFHMKFFWPPVKFIENCKTQHLKFIVMFNLIKRSYKRRNLKNCFPILKNGNTNGWWFCNYGLLSLNTKTKWKLTVLLRCFAGLGTFCHTLNQSLLFRNQPFCPSEDFRGRFFSIFRPFFSLGLFWWLAPKRARIHR